jgi:hypothetical protein
MKKLILKWLGLNQIVVTDAQIERVVESLLARRYDLEGVCSQVEDIQGLVDDLDGRWATIESWDLWEMSRSIEDHTSAIETLEEKLDAIYSPEGYEVTLTAKVKGVQNG